MAEFTAAERHDAPGYTNKDGTPAELFSSDNTETVLRHFQWMEAYGIDGVTVQRFAVELKTPHSALRMNRRVNHTLAAAEKTGRVMYIEYDLTSMKEADIVATLTKDWAMLTESYGVTKSPRYLHHNGLPVSHTRQSYERTCSYDTAILFHMIRYSL